MLFVTMSFKNIVSDIFYRICEGISSVISTVLGILPDNPFSDFTVVPSEVSKILGYVNYFLPIKQSIVVIIAWLGALIIIAVYKLVVGFFKLVGG